MKNQAITNKEIYQMAQKGLFIRGEVNRLSFWHDKGRIYLLCGIPVAKGVYLNYVEYRYTYNQISDGRDFVSHLEHKVFAPNDDINIMGILKIWDNWGPIKLFQKKCPEVIFTKMADLSVANSILNQLPLSDPAVITHLARFQGMIGQSRDPKVQDDGLELVYTRLGALISQQLKKWSQTVG